MFKHCMNALHHVVDAEDVKTALHQVSIFISAHKSITAFDLSSNIEATKQSHTVLGHLIDI